jgi:hypothetical protein
VLSKTRKLLLETRRFFCVEEKSCLDKKIKIFCPATFLTKSSKIGEEENYDDSEKDDKGRDRQKIRATKG